MADELTPETNADETTQQPQGSETDWKAEARKWEKYAKENKAARDELDALKAAQMTEQEKLVKRAEEAEAKLAAANATIQHAADVAEIAAQSGVPAALLEFCADRDAMEEFAKQYGESNPAPVTHSAPSAPANRQYGSPNTKKSNADAFADMLDDIL